MMQLIVIATQLLIAKLKGERYFALVLRPEKRRIVSHVRRMSAPLIRDGMDSSLQFLIDRGDIRMQWSDAERDEFGIK